MNRKFANLFLVFGMVCTLSSCVYHSSRNAGSSAAGSEAVAANAAETPRAAAPVSGFRSKNEDNGDFIVEYQTSASPRFSETDRRVKTEKLLEKAADRLNQALILPADVYLRTKDCGEINAFYDAGDRSVTVCYELMDHFYNIFKPSAAGDAEAYSKMFDAVRFVFLHEIGHALIDQYNLPITGSEEEAADRCSAFINLNELGDEGVKAVFAAADAFSIESAKPTARRSRMADEHLLQEQRFYNSLCMIYGSNSGKYSNIVSKGYLPRERASRCPDEFQRTVSSWMDLLGPWRKI